MEVDYGRTADDYKAHRPGFPASFFGHIRQLGLARPGRKVVNLGTGTGNVARGFAAAGCRVVGIDRSEGMLSAAREIDAAARSSVTYRAATAEETGLQAQSVDLVVSGQCWHWFDGRRAAREARRIVVAGGHVVIAHFDWLPLPGNVAQATEKLILSHNPAWKLAGRTGLYPEWLDDLAMAGFQEIRSLSYDETVAFSHESWRGRIRASAGVGAMLNDDQVRRFDEEHATLLTDRFPHQPFQIPHRVFIVWAQSPRCRAINAT